MTGTYKVVFMAIDDGAQQRQFAETDWPDARPLPEEGMHLTLIHGDEQGGMFVVTSVRRVLVLEDRQKSAGQREAESLVQPARYSAVLTLAPKTPDDLTQSGPNVVPFPDR